MAFFVAFYSYKGGVGRSLALANVAYSLASRGKRVVLLDLDLEAPGLQEIPELALKGSGAKKGFLDYAASYRKTGRCPEISRYVHACRESPGQGKLWVMPAGALGASYQEQLGTLAWKRLHAKKGTEPFVDELRTALAQDFAPDYVLIDSRTGLSDIGGLSTHRLADMVVLVFNLTRPSIEGSVRAYRSFTSEESRIRTVQLVASPVPPLVPGADSIAERRLQQATDLMPLSTSFGRSLIRIDYDPAMVLAEDLAVRRPEAFQAASRYEALREALQRANPEEVFPVLEQARELRSGGRWEEGRALLSSFAESHPDNAEGYLEWGNFLFEAGRASEAGSAFQTACHLAPDLSLGYRRLGEALVAAERAEEAIQALERAEALGDESRELYRALAQAYALNQEPSREIEARRKAMLLALGSPRQLEQDPPFQDLQSLRREFIEVLSRRSPFPGFQPESFWDSILMSLNLSLASKVHVLQQVLAGDMLPGDLNDLLRTLREENTRWSEILGADANEVRRRVAEKYVDPFDVNAVLDLRRGDKADSAVFGFIALNTDLPISQRILFLEKATQHPLADQALQRTLLDILSDSLESENCFASENTAKLLIVPSSQESHLPPNWATTWRSWIDVPSNESHGSSEAKSFLKILRQKKKKSIRLFNVKAGNWPGCPAELDFGDVEFRVVCALTRLEHFDDAATFLRARIKESPELRSQVLQNPDLQPLWAAKPELKAEIERSLAETGDAVPGS